MNKYPKIETVFKRDPDNKFKTLLDGEFADPEFEFLADNDWTFTEKVDGTNIRVMWDGANMTFGGKSEKAQIPPLLNIALHTIFEPMVETFAALWSEGEVCLYGEGFGAGIQKGGGNYRPHAGFVLFDVEIDDWWLNRVNVEAIAADLGIEVVPVIGVGTLRTMVNIAGAGFTSHWGDFPAEGIVARPAIELRTRGGRRIITKVKHKDFAVVQEPAEGF